MSALPPSAPALIPVIWNASAGQKVRGPLRAPPEDQLREALDAAGVRARLIRTQSEEEADAAVRRLVAEGAPLVVAAGGDGTIGQIARDLLGSEVALGVLPLGSVMNIPRMLGVPRELPAAAALLARPRLARIDVGEANGRVFFETVSVGMNAAMFAAAQHFEDGDWGSPLRVLWVTFRYRPALMHIGLDDDQQVQTRGLMVAISNGGYMGVGMGVAPDARLDDGRFDVRVFRHFSKSATSRSPSCCVTSARSCSAGAPTSPTSAPIARRRCAWSAGDRCRVGPIPTIWA